MGGRVASIAEGLESSAATVTSMGMGVQCVSFARSSTRRRARPRGLGLDEGPRLGRLHVQGKRLAVLWVACTDLQLHLGCESCEQIHLSGSHIDAEQVALVG